MVNIHQCYQIMRLIVRILLSVVYKRISSLELSRNHSGNWSTSTWNCKQVNPPGYPRFIRARFLSMAEQGLNQWEKTLHRQHLSSGNRPCAGIHAFWFCMFPAWMCVPRSRLNCIPGLARSLGPVPNTGPRVPENGVARWRQQNWQIYSAYPVIYQYSPPVQLT